MSDANDRCLLVFAKCPQRGAVKTRLASEVGEAAALRLYTSFLHDTLVVARSTGVPLVVYVHPADAVEQARSLLGSDVCCAGQPYDDLGANMKCGFERAFADGFQRAVCIGSDLPDLRTDVLLRALESLKSHEAVVGPSGDGGYYLIGFSRDGFLPEAFDGMHWGGNSVYRQTMDALVGHERSVAEVPVWDDVDTSADLKALIDRNRGNVSCMRETRACVEQLSREMDILSEGTP